jgi:hypothetical protein
MVCEHSETTGSLGMDLVLTDKQPGERRGELAAYGMHPLERRINRKDAVLRGCITMLG